MIFVRSWPALPTKGSPCRSSSAPGASPTNSQFCIQTPNAKNDIGPRRRKVGAFHAGQGALAQFLERRRFFLRKCARQLPVRQGHGRDKLETVASGCLGRIGDLKGIDGAALDGRDGMETRRRNLPGRTFQSAARFRGRAEQSAHRELAAIANDQWSRRGVPDSCRTSNP